MATLFQRISLVATLVVVVDRLDVGIAGGAVQQQAVDRASQTILDSVEQNMVRIEGGTFKMGDPSARDTSTEKPVHLVTVKAFRMCAHEVTFDEYDAYVRSTGAPSPEDEGWGRGTRPVINVSWNTEPGYSATLATMPAQLILGRAVAADYF
jgi:formylglycine-generating enzyme required for sulfatase activity